MTRFQPSTRTNSRILNGSEMKTGGSIIMPIAISVDADDEVDDQERQEDQEPDLERRLELGDDEGGDQDLGRDVRARLGRSTLPSLTNSARSFVRVWSNMNSRSGSSARLSASSCVILPFCSGSKASFLISLKVGAITKSVRKSAMPTSTWFGGAVGVPRPVRMKPRTIRMRVKPVTVKSSGRDQRDAADEQQQLDRVRAVGLHLTTVLERRMFEEAPSAARGGRPRLDLEAGRASRRVDEQAERARLGLACRCGSA